MITTIIIALVALAAIGGGVWYYQVKTKQVPPAQSKVQQKVNYPILVISPRDKEIWRVGETREIKWSIDCKEIKCEQIAGVEISIIDVDKPNFSLPIVNFVSNTGVYKWNIPSAVGGEAYIKFSGKKYKVFVFLVGYGDAGLGKGESLPFVINGGSEN